jgi:hypothetical protein
MVPNARRDDSRTPMDQGRDTPRREAAPEDGNRQPEMSEPAPRPREQGAELVHWLVPDTRDDIVVSRCD